MASARYQLLKDFLEYDSNSHFNITNSRKPMFAKLSKSLSSKVVSTAILAIQRAFNAVKHFHFINSVMSPSQLGWVTCTDVSVEASVVKVRVKDILRWRSFKDLAEEEPPSLDRCDLTMQWGGTSSSEEDELSKKGVQQDSPISILNFNFQEDGRKNLLMHNRRDIEYRQNVDSVEVNHREQVNVQKKQYEEGDFETKVDTIALIKLFSDFFHDELATSKNENVFENNLGMVKGWMNSECDESCEWDLKGNKAACVREMDNKDGRWSKFEEEKRELAVEVETRVFDCLIDDLLIELVKENI